ncbi:rhodanese-like domain-containing protein [Myroides albus]|uniref:Rhodanese-like domain-containing protein n=1 Tax=Myroides albus TaxID=2562892 RepID=A0A6I3LD89_9FLAO|nr:rhodanese-like domain-containing protein [Myroides albus]MTG97449.1 rhodanese-like domain-containing protein [Myroides albus]UVD79480.1 rhodanese-like domain-containing protein [Myroides albus]
MMIKTLFLTVMLSSLSLSASYAQENNDKFLLNKESFEVISKDNKSNVIDVRTAKEFSEGSIGEAKNIDFLKEDFIDQMKQFDKQEPIYIFCKSGKRSAKAKQALVNEGFLQVYELDGGYTKWIEE